MHFFFEIGNRYLKKSNWFDLSMIKFCLCSMGIMLGSLLPKKAKKVTLIASSSVFGLTYFILMIKVFGVIKELYYESKCV